MPWGPSVGSAEPYSHSPFGQLPATHSMAKSRCMPAAVEPRPRPGSCRWHAPAAAAGVAAIYYVGAKLGLALTVPPLPVSILWPPNALLLAALLVSPRRWWWGLIA